jgi:hypothetical protein
VINFKKENIIKKISKYLSEDNWVYEVEGNCITTDVRINKSYPKVKLLLAVKDNGYDLFVSSETVLKSKDIPAVMEFITRVNNSFTQGFFQLDIDNGTYGFKSFSNFREAEISKQTFILSVYLPIIFFSQYNTWINKIISGELSSAEAAKKAAEKSMSMLEKK